jgi:hypothetical protein
VRRRWLGFLVLAPLMLGGCGSGETPAAAPTSPPGAPWLVLASGNATPSPIPSGGTGTRSPYPSGFLPLPPGAAAPAPTGSDACPPVKKQVINGADATAGTTSGTVTWYDPGTADLVEYRVTAISQDAMLGEQRDVGWTVVTPGATCGYLTATVTGLDRGTRYVFSVDAVSKRNNGDGTYSSTVARSGVVKTS